MSLDAKHEREHDWRPIQGFNPQAGDLVVFRYPEGAEDDRLIVSVIAKSMIGHTGAPDDLEMLSAPELCSRFETPEEVVLFLESSGTTSVELPNLLPQEIRCVIQFNFAPSYRVFNSSGNIVPFFMGSNRLKWREFGSSE